MNHFAPSSRLLPVALSQVLMIVTCVSALAGQRPQHQESDTVPSLGLEQGYLDLETAAFDLTLVRSSQTVAALRPKAADGFDFTPGDWLEQRSGNGYFHLGDVTLRLRTVGSSEWRDFSTAAERAPVEALPTSGSLLAAADLAATLPADLPLGVLRYWEIDDDQLVLRIDLTNKSGEAVEIGALGIPMVFNNILSDRSLDEAHSTCSFYDPYVGVDAGYLQVTRLNGHGPALVVVPLQDTPFEAYAPLLSDPTNRGITFEGFHEWMVHSKAHAETEWSEADPWNAPTSRTLVPGETDSYGVKFLIADEIRNIEATLLANDRPVAVGIPGYVLPTDLQGKLFVKHVAEIRSIVVEPAGAVSVTAAGTVGNGWNSYDVQGVQWGRARLTVEYENGTKQTIHYKVVKPQSQVVADLGHFLTTEQWFEDPNDPFGRSPSVISYDNDELRQVTEDNRAWIAGLGDEGGSGSWLAAMMKQLVRPDPEELAKLQRFVDGVLWGGLQYDAGEFEYGVRKSLFYYEPDSMPPGTYGDSVGYGGWSSWDKEHSETVGRSYNYPHVAAAHWVLYRLARNNDGLVTNHPWDWYLERAYQTGEAMVRHAAQHAQFGQMEGTVFVEILRDLEREAWTAQADALRVTMAGRAELWRSLGYPFGSEMPWDSTGQEEVYAWCRYFGFDEKALVTLNAILGYMPTVPHWGYNGSARRYWDFWYAGKLRRLERQLHHYGSGLNSIPVLSEYRNNPNDLYLLRVGYGGVMGAIANITEEGFGPSGFHSFPSTLRIDGYSGDYGPGFFGHAMNAGTYVTQHPEFGWLAFGGNLTVETGTVRVRPLDSARSRIYIAPLGIWLTLDAGRFESVEISDDVVRVSLTPATSYTANARLRVEQPATLVGIGTFAPVEALAVERDAYVVPLRDGTTDVILRPVG